MACIQEGREMSLNHGVGPAASLPRPPRAQTCSLLTRVQFSRPAKAGVTHILIFGSDDKFRFIPGVYY